MSLRSERGEVKTVHVNWRKTAAVCAICVLIFLGTAPIANAQTSPSAMLDQFRAVRMRQVDGSEETAVERRTLRR